MMLLWVLACALYYSTLLCPFASLWAKATFSHSLDLCYCYWLLLHSAAAAAAAGCCCCRFVQEPYLSEINNYIRQRREHITFFTTPQVRLRCCGRQQHTYICI
jgi:hypothetical protein